MNRCRICNDKITPFVSFGRMPIANGFLSPEQFKDEYFFDLEAACCGKCGMVQLVEQPDPKMMFHDNYAFLSSTSSRMQVHYKDFAARVINGNLKERHDPFVVEVGSNDGIMLKHFALRNIRHLGIEPSANVAKAAARCGVNTICAFFDERLAGKILKEYGQMDAFLGANVMCHIPDLNSVIAGIKILLKPEGVVMFEDPYLGDIIEKTSYDQIYDEHVFLFSVSSIKYAFARHGLELVDIEAQATHGGSMRYVLAHKGKRPVSEAVRRQLEKEDVLGLGRMETYDRFRINCEKSRKDLVSLLKRLRVEGKRIAGYAATSKSTTVINYCGIGPDLIEFISDTTPIKQDKFTPGMHIPVRPYRDFESNYPDYALLFAWNHEAEIAAKETRFTEGGGRFILYVPEVCIK